MSKQYSVTITYQALLVDGRALSLRQYGEVTALDAEAAILDALSAFHREREKRPHVIEVWGLKADVTLASDVERQEREALLPAEDAELERLVTEAQENQARGEA